jgi:4-aminobutyrate--pyruvate transaminase
VPRNDVLPRALRGVMVAAATGCCTPSRARKENFMNEIARSLRGNSNAARDIAYHLHPYSHLRKHMTEGPLTVVRGRGVYVFDDDGKQYIEGMAGLWSASLGFHNDRLTEAAARQMRELPFYHSFNHRSHEPAINLAEKLIEMAPVPMSKVFFANSGSEANDSAVKLIWYYHNAIGKPAKKKIIGRMKGYHGVTVAAASLTGLPNNHRDFDLPIANILHTDCPHHYRFAKDGETEEQFATRCAESLEQLILREGPETIAAMFCEPVLGAGGVIVPPRTYYTKIQAVLKKYDVLLVADEVICGFGRTGNVWGTQTLGLQPDMLTCAKALSASFLPISALMISEKIHEALMVESDKIGVFGHGFTYSGHPVAAAVALEAQKIYEETDLFGHARRLSPTFQAALQSFAGHPLVGEVMGVGMFGAIELVADKKTKQAFEPAGAIGGRVSKIALENGLMVRNMADRVAVCPPLIITEAETADLFGRLRQALDKTLEEIRAEGLFKG